MTDPTDAARYRQIAGSADAARPRIWVMHCPFRKDGTPSLGSFGKTIRPVVILPMETWTALCREIPELGKHQFEVGACADND